jgi:hypothetical protein
MAKIKLGRALRISFSKSTMKIHLKLGTFLNFYTLICLNPTVSTMGLLNRVKGDEYNRYMLFMDFDDAMIKIIWDDVLFAQRQYDAGTAVILQSGETDSNIAGDVYGNFHVIFPQKFSFEEVNEIIGTACCDEGFKTISSHFNWRAHCLRIYPKYSENGKLIQDRPKLYDVMYAETRRETNTAMYDFLRKYYLMPEWKLGFEPNLDTLTTLSVLKYNTTMGWNFAVMERLKSFGAKIKMQVRGVF